MTNIILLAVCFLAGIGLRRTGRFPDTTPAVLNGYIIHLALPALALLHVHRLTLEPKLLLAGTMAWLVFAAGYLFFRAMGKLAGFSADTIGALILVGGLGNTSFVGLPMIEAYYGKEQIGIGLIADQLGSFPTLAILGVLVASTATAGKVEPRKIARKILLFPPFQALVLAILLKPVPFPDWLSTVLQKLGDTVTPLALVSVGFQLHFTAVRQELKALSLGLCYKLILAPALMVGLFVGILGIRGTTIQVTVFEAAMAPMITAGIIAVDHKLNPALVTLMIGIGIPLSFITLPAWFWLLRSIA